MHSPVANTQTEYGSRSQEYSGTYRMVEDQHTQHAHRIPRERWANTESGISLAWQSPEEDDLEPAHEKEGPGHQNALSPQNRPTTRLPEQDLFLSKYEIQDALFLKNIRKYTFEKKS